MSTRCSGSGRVALRPTNVSRERPHPWRSPYGLGALTFEGRVDHHRVRGAAHTRDNATARPSGRQAGALRSRRVAAAEPGDRGGDVSRETPASTQVETVDFHHTRQPQRSSGGRIVHGHAGPTHIPARRQSLTAYRQRCGCVHPADASVPRYGTGPFRPPRGAVTPPDAPSPWRPRDPNCATQPWPPYFGIVTRGPRSNARVLPHATAVAHTLNSDGVPIARAAASSCAARDRARPSASRRPCFT